MNFNKAVKLIEQGIADDVFPCAAYAIGNKERVFVKNSVGYKTLYPQKSAVTPNTLFDMASLSKIISTTMIALKAIETGKLCLDDKIHDFYEKYYDKGDLTIKNLLTHTSGISAHIPLYTFGIKPNAAIATILKSPFDYKTNRETVYSCMGYILLGDILQKIYEAPLNEIAEKLVFSPLSMENTTYKPMSSNVASTEFCKDLNDYACGTVHDENARFLGGVSGNAGVFSTLDDVIKFCTMLSKNGDGFLSPATFSIAVKSYTPSFSENRGLGFLLTGSKPTFAGDLLSEGSFGHTGFTGGSLVVDKVSGVYAILLTNRVHFGRENDQIIRFRRRFYNSVYGAF